MEGNIDKRTKPKYSEMLIQLVSEFDDQLPKELSFEDTLDIGIDAWSFANNKEFLESNNLFEKELKSREHHLIIKKMIDYKIEKFSESNNIIISYTLKENSILVKTQTQENHFNSIIKQIVTTKQKK